MVWKAALVLAAALPQVVLDEAGRVVPQDAAWAMIAGEGGIYWVMRDDIIANSPLRGEKTLWLRSSHRLEKSIPYRTALVRITFNCHGQFGISAYSYYRADGSVYREWDSRAVFPASNHVRPNTVYADLERYACAPPK